MISQSYYNNDELASKVLDADGWYKSGDAGYFDVNGALHVLGRIQDMIKIDGKIVSSNFYWKSFFEDSFQGSFVSS